MNMKQEVSVTLAGGKTLSFETGRLAKQAHGSVLARLGDSVVLATATANPDPREGIDFFPLTVEIGRASCRERVKISVVAVSLKKKKKRSAAQIYPALTIKVLKPRQPAARVAS